MLVLIKAGPNLRQVLFRGQGKKVAEGNRGLGIYLFEEIRQVDASSVCGNTLYCICIKHGKRSLQHEYNFETKAHTDFKYVPNESSKIAPFTQSGFIVIRL